MKTRFLFPAFFRLIGCLLALPGFILGYFVVYQDYKIPGFGFVIRQRDDLILHPFENFTNELALTLVVAGMMFMAFSKVKNEDELTGRIRLNALYWAMPVNYIWYAFFLIVSLVNTVAKSPALGSLLSLFEGNSAYLVYNFFVPLLIFIARFYYLFNRNAAGYPTTGVLLLPYKPFNALGKWLSYLVVLLVAAGQLFIQSQLLDGLFWVLPFTLLIWMYAKEKVEDEYINYLRLDALQIAVFINYIILLLSNFMFYGVDFLMIQIFNLATIPLIFIIRFQYRLYRLRRSEAKTMLTLSL